VTENRSLAKACYRVPHGVVRLLSALEIHGLATQFPFDVRLAIDSEGDARVSKGHPQGKASACSVEDGRVLVRLDRPCLVAVYTAGQMEGRDTGKGYNGPPIDAISLFAKP
jgi:hypothetical protein